MRLWRRSTTASTSRICTARRTTLGPPLGQLKDNHARSYAHGLLFKDQIAALIPQFFQYIDAEIEHFAGFLPKVCVRGLWPLH